MSTPSSQRGIVFFAHGSRDPQWRLPIEAVAQQLLLQHPQARCCTAYLELTEPDLPRPRDLVGQGCTHITVLPMFLGTGRHARQDLPVLVAGLREQHPQVQFEVATAVGEDARLTALLAEMAHQYIA